MRPGSSGLLFYGWSLLVSVPFLNIPNEMWSQQHDVLLFPGWVWGNGRQLRTFEFVSPGAKAWTHTTGWNPPGFLPPANDFDIYCSCLCLQHSPGSAPSLKRHRHVSLPARPAALPLGSPSLPSKMFSAHKSRGWREQLRAEREGAGRPHHLQWKRTPLTPPRKLMERP